MGEPDSTPEVSILWVGYDEIADIEILEVLRLVGVVTKDSRVDQIDWTCTELLRRAGEKERWSPNFWMAVGAIAAATCANVVIVEAESPMPDDTIAFQEGLGGTEDFLGLFTTEANGDETAILEMIPLA
jgi:hypothetical protein